MGKHEPMTAKAIANKIKAKGLQKLKYYCEMCKKQCRDANGFKCHVESETHHRQLRLVSENTEKYVNEYSQEFHENFMHIFKTRYRHEKILANTIFQEYIKDRDHCHLNATRWLSLTDYANWLSEKGLAKVDESERGVLITYIDNDPKTLQRKELDRQRETKAREAAERADKEIKTQMEQSKKMIDRCRRVHIPEPIAFVEKPKEGSSSRGNSVEKDRICVRDAEDDSIKQKETNNDHEPSTTNACEDKVPIFNIQPFSLKLVTAETSKYKPFITKRKKKKQKINR